MMSSKTKPALATRPNHSSWSKSRPKSRRTAAAVVKTLMTSKARELAAAPRTQRSPRRSKTVRTMTMRKAARKREARTRAVNHRRRSSKRSSRSRNRSQAGKHSQARPLQSSHQPEAVAEAVGADWLLLGGRARSVRRKRRRAPRPPSQPQWSRRPLVGGAVDARGRSSNRRPKTTVTWPASRAIRTLVSRTTTQTRRTWTTPTVIRRCTREALPLTRTKMTMTASSHGRNTAMSARTEATSCAARAAPRSPTTSASGSKWPPEATGGARIALRNGQPLRRSRRIAGSTKAATCQQATLKCPMAEGSQRRVGRPLSPL